MAGRYALIVATDAYADPKLSRLRAPARDAEALAKVLSNPEIGEFEVELALNQPDAVLRRRIAAFFSDRRREELLLLHFSCHGLKDDSGQLYFAAADTEVAHLDATALPAEFVSRQMTRSRSNNVLMLLDCCYSGAIARGLTFRAGDRVDVNDHLGGSGRAIITASSAMEYAFEGDELTGEGRPSVFTSAVVKALETGEADRDQDNWISVRELYDFVCDEVREITPNQRPNMLSHLEGELYVARSRWLAPATLPRELLDGLANQFSAVREGAVAALVELLGGRDQALAAAARRRLETIAATDDSRRVSAAASAALAASPAARPRVAAPPPPEPPPVAAARRDTPAKPLAAAPRIDPTPPAAAPRRDTPAKPLAAVPHIEAAPPTPPPAKAAARPRPAVPASDRVRRAWRQLDQLSKWLVAGALLIVVAFPLPWDYSESGLQLLTIDTYRVAAFAAVLVLIATLAVLRWRGPATYALFVLATATLGFLVSILGIGDGEGESGLGLWLAIIGVAVVLVTAARIVLAAPERARARVLPAEAVAALAALYAFYVVVTQFYDPVVADLIVVTALAVLTLALPRPARLRPLALLGFGAFIAAYVLLSEIGDAAARLAVAAVVMILAAGFALYQRTAQA